MSSEEETLGVLESKRGLIKGTIARYQLFLNSLELENIDKEEVESRFKRFEISLERFEEIQDKIELLLGTAQNEERVEVEEAYHKAVALTKRILGMQSGITTIHSTNNNDAAITTVQSTNNNGMTPIRVEERVPVVPVTDLEIKLPSIDLPKFDGKYNEWMTFRDMFTDLVHNNVKLSKSRKLYYLKTCVKGAAAKVIENISLAEDQYEVAWELLRQRYENKKRIVFKHMRAIYDLPVVQKESAVQLRAFLDEFNANFRALKLLGVTTDNWHVPIICDLSNKIDAISRKEWDRQTKKCELSEITTDKFLEFLTDRCLILENENEGRVYKHKHERITAVTVGVQQNTQNNMSCYFCQKQHLNQKCDQFVKMDPDWRLAEVIRLKLCKNCLRPNHFSYECRSVTCKFCHKKHHWLLHESRRGLINEQNKREPLTVEEIISPPEQQNASTSHTHTVVCSSVSETDTKNKISSEVTAYTQNIKSDALPAQVLLATAKINIFDAQGNAVQCRALLDGASQISYILTDLANKLNLSKLGENIPIEGINGTTTSTSKLINARISSSNNTYETHERFAVIEKITGRLPQISFDISKLKLPDNVELADENFNESEEIDILLGATIFYDILGTREKRLGKNMPILRETKLGWIIAGPIGFNFPKRVFCNLSVTNEDLHNQVKQFWAQEEVHNETKYNTREEIECEEHFMATYRRVENGRFEVSLPFKNNSTELGDSLQPVLKRFDAMERRFKRDEKFKKSYCTFMKEYEVLGHMTQITEQQDNETFKFYLPHHGVIKESSLTTKLRVVFDASSKSTSSLSLNDVLKTGPVIQPDLFSIVSNFRKYEIVIVGDIEKMYRQINVAPHDREFQRIVWRAEPSDEIKHYQLNTVTYGMAPASFLACRVLYQLAVDNEKRFPEASKAIKSNFYMDDLMTGADTIEQAVKLKTEITNILKSGGFPLGKWLSNRQELGSNLVSEGTIKGHDIERKDVKVLGLIWDPQQDCFSYSVNLNENPVVTKRFILATVAKIFDPLGLINPVIVNAKLILQNLWQKGIDWDEPVPPEILDTWYRFYDTLNELNTIMIPRRVICSNSQNIEIHGFCDASELAFGACVYIRVTDVKGIHITKLLCSKSRVAPLRKITLPRLELNGAFLLSKLVDKIMGNLDLNPKHKVLWTDSTIVLNWLAAEPCTWNTYVANRVTQIQDLTKDFEWRHVSSSQNPADIVSRGALPGTLLHNKLWWNGPDFLSHDDNLWPSIITDFSSDIPERKPMKQMSLVIINFDYFFERFCSFTKLHRVFAYMLKFIRKCRFKNKSEVHVELTINELNEAMITLVKIVQSAAFSTEINQLNTGKPTAKNSSIVSLNVFLDSEGILRVGGRIRHSVEHFDKRHPILLPYNHKFTRLLIDYEHKRNMHAGQQAVLAAVRTKFWPIKGRRLVRDVLSKCVTCFKCKPKNAAPLMGDLPKTRLTPRRPFSVVGVDYAGPILIKDSILRNRKFVKGYLCIFICFVTKAIHIELAVDLTTQAFLNCLKRFVSRRGLCCEIYSDNGTNFLGAANELKNVVRSLSADLELRNYLLENTVKWNFNTPFSPHQGGLWEAAVKSTKFHLTRILGNSHLTYESLYTVLCQVEAVLNSRPLIPMTQDPEDLAVLTPAHFLVGDTLMALPQIDVADLPVNRLKLYQQLQQMLQHFWRRWSNEYITTLQQRSKWKTQCASLQIDDMVLIKDNNTPPLCWQLGRVVQLHPGPDDISRVVSVRVKNGIIKRSVTRLCKLPITNE